MKIKNKGKVYPSPVAGSHLSVLNLLPATILTLISVLPLEDREVLAYMITRSMKTINPFEEKKHNGNNKKLPLFDCDCFDCYIGFWYRWDSSPNQEVIHLAIEAFEERFSNGELPKKGKNKKRQKTGRRGSGILAAAQPENETKPSEMDAPGTVLPRHDLMGTPENETNSPEKYGGIKVEEILSLEVEPLEAVVRRSAAANDHKGFARHVLPDVLGLFNSRLWKLLSPNV